MGSTVIEPVDGPNNEITLTVVNNEATIDLTVCKDSTGKQVVTMDVFSTSGGVKTLQKTIRVIFDFQLDTMP